MEKNNNLEPFLLLPAELDVRVLVWELFLARPYLLLWARTYFQHRWVLRQQSACSSYEWILHGRWMMRMLAPRGTCPSTTGTFALTFLRIGSGWNFELVLPIASAAAGGGLDFFGSLAASATERLRLR